MTGGTSTTGHAIVKHLAEQGAYVAFTGRNSEYGNVIANTTECFFIKGNDCESGEIDNLVHEAGDILGGLDGLVLNASMLHQSTISNTGDAEWDSILEINLIIPFLFTRACMPMLKLTGGAVVAITSGTALWTEMELGAYSISKRALLWMTQMLAVEAASFDIRVNAVCSDDFETSTTTFTSGSTPLDHEASLLPPLGRLATPEDIASAVAFFLSEDSSFCTGSSLLIDGGMRASLRASKVRN